MHRLSKEFVGAMAAPMSVLCTKDLQGISLEQVSEEYETSPMYMVIAIHRIEEPVSQVELEVVLQSVSRSEPTQHNHSYRKNKRPCEEVMVALSRPKRQYQGHFLTRISHNNLGIRG